MINWFSFKRKVLPLLLFNPSFIWCHLDFVSTLIDKLRILNQSFLEAKKICQTNLTETWIWKMNAFQFVNSFFLSYEYAKYQKLANAFPLEMKKRDRIWIGLKTQYAIWRRHQELHYRESSWQAKAINS